MKNAELIIIIIISALLFTTAAACAQEKIPAPLPPLTDVPQNKLINPDKGIGDVEFGDSIQKVEEVFGRGELIPGESDARGNSISKLSYPAEGLVFSFLNGQLCLITINKPGYGTAMGSQVGGEVGDLVREFGSKYIMDKSIVQAPDPNEQEFSIMWDKISAQAKGRIILSLAIKTTKQFKNHK